MKTLEQQVVHERTLINKHVIKLNNLLASCTHEYQVILTKYIPGGYLDTAYTEQWTECTLCKKIFNTKIIQRGGFA